MRNEFPIVKLVAMKVYWFIYQKITMKQIAVIKGHNIILRATSDNETLKSAALH